MPLRCILTLTLLIPICLFGQQERYKYNWYLSNTFRMSFRDTGFYGLIDDNKLQTQGMPGGFSDSSIGDPLFHTDGLNVYNMAGKLLVGNGTPQSAQDIKIIPVPGKPKHYYSFVSFSEGGIKLTEIDMSFNSGMGRVITSLNPVLKNARNKFTVIQVCENRYWLISAQLGQEPIFRATPVTAKGIDTTLSVSTRIGAAWGSANQDFLLSKLIASPDGKKIALLLFDYINSPVIELFDFDGSTGRPSNMKTMNSYPCWEAAMPLCLGFSPGSSKLYTASYCAGLVALCQFDLTAGDPDLTRHVVEKDLGYVHDLEIGPDGNMYVLHSIRWTGQENISVFDFDVNDSIIYPIRHLAYSQPIGNQFPHFVSLRQDKNLDFKIQHVCGAPVAEFVLNRKTRYALWDYGDGIHERKDSVLKFSHIFPAYGFYTVILKAIICLGDTLKMEKKIELRKEMPLNLGKDFKLCQRDTATLSSNLRADAYEWSTGSKDSAIKVSIAGRYWLKVQSGSCTYYDTISVSIYPSLWSSLGKEYFICEEDSKLAFLDAGKDFVHYLWYPTGDTTQWIVVSKTGNYYVVVDDFRGCKGEFGTMVEEHCRPYLYFPNAFSPNNDGINDVFKPAAKNITGYKLFIYNRWGERVFTSDNVETGWDGKMHGLIAPEGIYIYKAMYSGYQSGKNAEDHFFLNGTLNLLR